MESKSERIASVGGLCKFFAPLAKKNDYFSLDLSADKISLRRAYHIVSYFFNVDFLWQDLGAREDGLQLVRTDCTFFAKWDSQLQRPITFH